MTLEKLKALSEKITPGEWLHDDGHIFIDSKQRNYNSIAHVFDIYKNDGSAESNAEAISLTPQLLKRAIEYEDMAHERDYWFDHAKQLNGKISELEETEKSLRKTQDQLLSKIRQLEDTVEFGFSEGTPLQHNKARIRELEAKIEALTKQNSESLEAMKIAVPHVDSHFYPNEKHKIEIAIAKADLLTK